jgi:tetratricopeptide (TPR) repeat protein
LASSYNNLGLLEKGQGNLLEAETLFRRALSLDIELYNSDRDHLEYAIGLGGTYCNLGINCGRQTDSRAQVAVSAALSLLQPGVQAWNVLGAMVGAEAPANARRHEARSCFTQAIQVLQRVLTRDPRNVKAREFLRNAFLGRIELGAEPGEDGLTQLIADCDELLQLVEDPARDLRMCEMLVKTHKARGVACQELGRFKNAIQSFTFLIERAKDQLASMIVSAVGLAGGQHNLWHAGWVAGTMIKDDRHNLRVSHGKRATAYRQLKKYPEALVDLDRAVDLADTKDQRRGYRMFRAMMLVEAGRVAEGVAEATEVANEQDLSRHDRAVLVEDAVDFYRWAWQMRPAPEEFLGSLRLPSNVPAIKNHQDFQSLFREVREAAVAKKPK